VGIDKFALKIDLSSDRFAEAGALPSESAPAVHRAIEELFARARHQDRLGVFRTLRFGSLRCPGLLSTLSVASTPSSTVMMLNRSSQSLTG
jgi:hypothetical protein